MAHVQIKSQSAGSYSVVVDGVDLSTSMLRDGFSLSLDEDGVAVVSARFRASTLDVDLPESVVQIEAVD